MLLRSEKSLAPDQSIEGCDRELVVLVHGLAASRMILRPLERRLWQSGFETLNWGYCSIRGDIRELGQALAELLRDLEADNAIDRIHLVTHSMGSILARVALTKAKLPGLGRVVMLGPPNGGSPVATKLAPAFSWFCKPLKQLSDRPDSFVNSLPQPFGYEIGIIAAAHDRVVRIEDTKLCAQTDHITVRSGHTSMLIRSDVAELVKSFLRNGAFDSRRSATSSSRLRTAAE